MTNEDSISDIYCPNLFVSWFGSNGIWYINCSGNENAKVDKTTKLLEKKLKHIKARKQKYWGKSEIIYLFFHAQQILIEDLLLEIENGR